VIPNFAHFTTTLKSKDEIVFRLGIQNWPKISFFKSCKVIPNFAHFVTTLKSRDEILSQLDVRTWPKNSWNWKEVPKSKIEKFRNLRNKVQTHTWSTSKKNIFKVSKAGLKVLL
jgi:hypothetical protein